MVAKGEGGWGRDGLGAGDLQMQTVMGEGGWRRDGLGAGDSQMQTVIYRTDKQQDPTVWHRERYSIFCGKFL